LPFQKDTNYGIIPSSSKDINVQRVLLLHLVTEIHGVIYASRVLHINIGWKKRRGIYFFD